MAIALLSTLDTKGYEIAFLKKCLEERGRSALVVDVGLFDPQGGVPDISRDEVAAASGADVESLLKQPRGEVMATMGRGAGEVLRRLHAEGRLDGALGLGGNQGTSVICAGMRQLPLGLPKLVVSTVASGNMRPYIGASDIAMLFSVADLLGGHNYWYVMKPESLNANAESFEMLDVHARKAHSPTMDLPQLDCWGQSYGGGGFGPSKEISDQEKGSCKKETR